jgi:hypothetical protein
MKFRSRFKALEKRIPRPMNLPPVFLRIDGLYTDRNGHEFHTAEAAAAWLDEHFPGEEPLFIALNGVTRRATAIRGLR